MRQLLPLIFEWLSQAPDPDMGLLGLRSLTTGDHRRAQLTSVFRESAEAARQLCLLLGTGPRFVRTFERNPDLMLALGDRGPAVPPPALRPARGANLLGVRHRQTLQIAADDVLGRATVEATGRALSRLAEAILTDAVERVDPQVPMAVIAMGRLGGGELSYASDLDVLFVFDGAGQGPAAPAVVAEAAAAALLRLIGGDTPARRLYELDAGLRPEGRHGPLARSLAAYATYYERWAQPWERQALLRGRFVAGDPSVGERFAAIARAFACWASARRSARRACPTTETRLKR